MTHYDYIIAGGGMAGLSLAYHLTQSPLRSKRILLIDRAPKTRNDRTWAFWEDEAGPFDSILYRRWDRVWFHGPSTDSRRFSQQLDLGPYQYKLLRGLDFYQFVDEALNRYPNVERLYSPVQQIHSDARRGTVVTGAGTYTADWVFDSTFRLDAMRPFDTEFRPLPAPPPPPGTGTAQTLLQHFKGWVVRTPTAAFDPAIPTMMDFRIDQHDECRFVYVMPFSETEALIEFTLFTPALLPPAAYDEALRAYLRDWLGVGTYAVLEEEFGIIPMSDEPTPERPSPRVLRIGTAGGTTRPSTGYTFRRTQRHLRAVVAHLVARGEPVGQGGPAVPIPALYRWMDQVFLNVFLHKRHAPAGIFTALYRHSDPVTVFRFLDEEATPAQLLRVVWSVPKGPFIRAALDVLRRSKRP